MRARNFARTGLSLTREPRSDVHATPDQADHKLAKQVAWGALLVSAAAIAGYLAGPLFSPAPSPAAAGASAVIEGGKLQPE